jgi:hypothetical protein
MASFLCCARHKRQGGALSMGFVFSSFLGVRRSKREAIGRSHLGENSLRDEAHHYRKLSHAPSITAPIRNSPAAAASSSSTTLGTPNAASAAL